jgi:hypothetical protein
LNGLWCGGKYACTCDEEQGSGLDKGQKFHVEARSCGACRLTIWGWAAKLEEAKLSHATGCANIGLVLAHSRFVFRQYPATCPRRRQFANRSAPVAIAQKQKRRACKPAFVILNF